MMAILVIIVVLLALFLWVLLAPLVIYINTDKNQYFIALKSIVKLSPRITSECIFLIISVPFHTFVIDLTKKDQQRKKKLPDNKKRGDRKRKSGSGKSMRSVLKLIQDLWKSFNVKRLGLNLDTGDFVTNARLIPVFSFLNRGNMSVATNFQGIQSFELHIRNSLGGMLLPILKFYFSK